MNVYKVIKEFSYDGNKKLYANTIVVEPTPNVIKFGKTKVGDTTELLEEGLIVEINIDPSYF